MIWFTSDTHFGHRRILELSSRPFPDIETMNAALIQEWNARVSDVDEAFHLGDFGFGTMPEMSAVFNQLKGHKHLVLGNHDRAPVKRQAWESVEHYQTVRHFNKVQHTFELFHFPMESWWHAESGALHVHGHVHGGVVPRIPHRFDVGVDPCSFHPVSADFLAHTARAQDFDPERYWIRDQVPWV